MSDINLINSPGIQEDKETNKRKNNIPEKSSISELKTIDNLEIKSEGNVTFRSVLLLLSFCILACSTYYYLKYINPELAAIYMDYSKDFDQKELFFQMENHIDAMNIKYIKTDNTNLVINMDVNNKENFYTIMNYFSDELGHKIKGYHIDNVFSLSIKTNWNIQKSNSLNLNLFDKELSDFNFNIKKELYKDKLIIISDVNTMMKVLQLMDDLNLIHRFMINAKVIDSIPNKIKLYQIIIS